MAFQATVEDDASSLSSYHSEATLPVPTSLREDDARTLSSIGSHDSYDSSCSDNDLPSYRVPFSEGTSQPVFEAWVLYYSENQYDVERTSFCGLNILKRYETSSPYVGFRTPTYEQDQLRGMTLNAVNGYHAANKRCLPSRLLRGRAKSYEQDLDQRIQKLPRPVQSELNLLLGDRESASCNRFHRRDWTVVMMREEYRYKFATTEHEEVKKKGKRFWTKKGDKRPIHYFFILRGEDGKVASDDKGMHTATRHGNPWKRVDEREREEKTHERNIRRYGKGYVDDFYNPPIPFLSPMPPPPPPLPFGQSPPFPGFASRGVRLAREGMDAHPPPPRPPVTNTFAFGPSRYNGPPVHHPPPPPPPPGAPLPPGPFSLGPLAYSPPPSRFPFAPPPTYNYVCRYPTNSHCCPPPPPPPPPPPAARPPLNLNLGCGLRPGSGSNMPPPPLNASGMHRPIPHCFPMPPHLQLPTPFSQTRFGNPTPPAPPGVWSRNVKDSDNNGDDDDDADRHLPYMWPAAIPTEYTGSSTCSMPPPAPRLSNLTTPTTFSRVTSQHTGSSVEYPMGTTSTPASPLPEENENSLLSDSDSELESESESESESGSSRSASPLSFQGRTTRPGLSPLVQS